MNKIKRNPNDKHFANIPRVNINRSTFDRSFGHKTSFNAGKLIPLKVMEVLPGDTHKVDMAAVVRSQAVIAPTMDSSYLDYFTFFVPMRLLMDNWKQLQGENTTSKWFEKNVNFEVPSITAPAGGWDKGSVADYMGIPTDKNVTISSLYFKAYTLAWETWFRDENTQDPALFYSDDTIATGVKAADGNWLQNMIKGGECAPINKYKDYFTSALPSPQKAESVLLPLLGEAPVYASGDNNDTTGFDGTNLSWVETDGQGIITPYKLSAIGTLNPNGVGKTVGEDTTLGQVKDLVPGNLKADLSKATPASINDLRYAIALQHIYENDARGGTRYQEKLLSHFGVTSPDASIQIPEYIDNGHIPLQQTQVAQSQSTTPTSPQANVAAYGLTGSMESGFTKSFTEHGILITVGAIRTKHTYQYGLPKMFSKFDRFDFYEPQLANIGEQPILNKELYISENTDDDKVFGYQEAWAEYRYCNDMVTGEMRSSYSQSLDYWHYGDKYANLPVLQDGFVEEVASNIDRSLAIKSFTADQFIADFDFKIQSTRPMPIYSVPGLDRI